LPKIAARTAPKPKTALNPKKTYYVTMQTNCGSFTIRLAVKASPHTSASFVSLVKRGFFDKTVFHRIVPGFIIQGGDPTASGYGGPGYSTIDKPPASLRYTHGVVAMAKAPNEASGTSGSQFFVVTVPNAQLPPQYALLGVVTKGLAVVDAIGKLGNAQQQPTQVVEIVHAFVTVR
jgi:peptidyl-prolyl cis-trans isomerase B (cyclophilin B)